jgi:hypothetical protein
VEEKPGYGTKGRAFIGFNLGIDEPVANQIMID